MKGINRKDPGKLESAWWVQIVIGIISQQNIDGESAKKFQECQQEKSITVSAHLPTKVRKQRYFQREHFASSYRASKLMIPCPYIMWDSFFGPTAIHYTCGQKAKRSLNTHAVAITVCFPIVLWDCLWPTAVLNFCVCFKG